MTLQELSALLAATFSIVLPLLARLNDVTNNQRIMREQNDRIITQNEHIDTKARTMLFRLRQIRERLQIGEEETDIEV